MKQNIIPSRLEKVRKHQDLTPSKLETRAADMKRSLTAKTVTNIEKKGRENNDAAVSVTEGTLEVLSLVLKVNKEVLTGDEPLLLEKSLSDPISIKISPQLALTYDLIERKYGISLEEAFELAPLLLTVSANKSLEQLRTSINNNEKNFGEYNSPHDSYNDTDFLHMLDIAANQNDVFAKSIDWIGAEEGITDIANPFASFLIEMCEQDTSVFISKEQDNIYFPDASFGYIAGTGIPSFSVCKDELDKITLGSNGAYNALASGVVRIKDIPEELWAPRNAGKRIEWLEEKYSLATSDEDSEAASP
jgi:hypothetical protein